MSDPAERDQRNLNPHAEALLAVYTYCHEYGAQTGGPVDFWDSLPEWKKTVCRDLLDRLDGVKRESQG